MWGGNCLQYVYDMTSANVNCEGARSSAAAHLEERCDPEKEEGGQEMQGEYSDLDWFQE